MTRYGTLLFVLAAALFGIVETAWSASGMDEARRHFNRGMAAVEMAKTPEDYVPAIKEFEQARDLAPDWADVYYNLGLVQEKAGKYRDAVTSLRRYLQLDPNSPDAAQVQALIDKTEYKAEQQITYDDVLDILASLTDERQWQIRGVRNGNDFHKSKWVKSIRRYRDGLMIAWPGGTCSQDQGLITKAFSPDGNTLKFSTYYCQCNASTQADLCPERFDYKLNVVSRSKVVMDVVWHFPLVHGVGGWTEDDIQVEFVKR